MRLLIAIVCLLGLAACNEDKCYKHVSWDQDMKAEVLPLKCSAQFHDRNWYRAQEVVSNTGDNYYLSVADSDTHVSLQSSQFQSQDEWVLGTTLQVEVGASTEYYGRFYTCTACPNQNKVVGQRTCIKPETVSLPSGQEQTMCSATAKVPDGPIEHQ